MLKELITWFFGALIFMIAGASLYLGYLMGTVIGDQAIKLLASF